MEKVPFKWLYLFLLVAIVVPGVSVAQKEKKDNAKTEEIVVEEVASEEVAASEEKKEEAATPEGEKEEVVVEETTEAEPKEDEAAKEDVGDEEAASETKEDEPAAQDAQDEPVTQEEPAAQDDKEEPAEEPTEEPTQEPAEEPTEEGKEEAAPAEGEEVEAKADEAQEAEKTEEPAAEPAEEPKEEPQEAKEPEPEPEKNELGPDEIMGIDTVDLEDPQGNWLYKRVWWERAEAKYEKIRVAVTSVLEVRTKFFAKRAELDKTVLDPFYIKIGLSQGELQERLAERIAKLERELQDKQEAQLLERLEADKQELEQLKQEVQEIVKQDEEVENAILMLVEQATKMRNYEQQAWQDFKNIARVLDDKKARELFYKVDGAWRNIQELQRYVESNFSTGFDTLIEKVSKKVQQVDSAMQALKEKGIDIKQLITEEDEVSEEEEEEEPPQGIVSRYIISPITSFVKAIWDIITWPIRKIMGTADVAPEEEDVVEEEVAEEVTEPTDEPSAPVSPATQAAPPSIPAPPDIATPAPSAEPEAQEEQEAVATDEDVPETEAIEVDVAEEPSADEGATNEDLAEPEGEGDAQVEETIDIEESEMPMFDELDVNMEELAEE